MYTINFFGKAGALYQKTRIQDQKILNISLIILGVTVLLFLGVLGFNLFSGQQLAGVSKKQNQTKQTLLSNQSIEIQYLVFSQKMKAIAEIFELRNNKQQAINYLSNLFGNDVFISGVSYDGEAQVLALNLTSASIFELDSLLQKLDSAEVKKNFTSLHKSSIRRNEDGSYDSKLTLELKQPKVADAKAPVKPKAPAKNATTKDEEAE